MPTREYCDGQDRPCTRVRRRKRRGRSVLRGATLSRPYRGHCTYVSTWSARRNGALVRHLGWHGITARREPFTPGARCCRHFADGGKGQVWVAGHGLVTRGFANGCSAALRNTHSTTPSCRCYCRIKAIFGERRPRCHRATEGVNSSVERLTHRLVDGRRRGGHGRHPAHIRAASVRCSASKQVASSAERPTATTTSTTFSASTQRSSRRTSGLQENRGYPRRITLSNVRTEANVGSLPTQGQ